MKIALINYNHSDSVIGGVETRYRLLGRALAEAGHQCEFIATEQMSLEEVLLRVSSCDLAISDSAIGLSTICPMITIFGNAWRGVLLAENSEHIHQVIHRETTWHRKHPSLRVAVSGYMREKEMLPSGITADHVIPNPADISRFRDLNDDRSRQTILWVGPSIPIKNPTAMLEVQKRIKTTHPQATWKFACRNDDTAADYDSMTHIIASATVVLCTSIAEGCSNTLMEAMAANVPIVTTSTGLFWDWWNSRLGVRISEAGQPADIAIGVRFVLDNPSHFAPRQVAYDFGLDYKSWANRWKWLVEDYAWRAR